MLMKAVAIAAVALEIAAFSGLAPAGAATCFREVVTGPTGHHELVRGCMVRERLASRAPRRTVTTTTRTITNDYYVTERPYTTTVTRDYYAAPVTRTWDEDLYYGSSYPEPGYGASYYPEPRYYGPLGY
jgi:hypothetical protein